MPDITTEEINLAWCRGYLAARGLSASAAAAALESFDLDRTPQRITADLDLMSREKATDKGRREADRRFGKKD